MKHTKGPWIVTTKAQGVMKDKIFYIHQESGAPLEIASLYINGYEPGIQVANAQLIATAPEMLEGLKNALQAIEMARDDYSKFMEFAVMYSTETRCIIAKAEGRT